MMRRVHPHRTGFALLAVLWVMVGVAVFGLTMTLAARESIATARNRTSATRAMWRANDCLERARAAIGDALLSSDASRAAAISPWLVLDSIVARTAPPAALGCHVELHIAGESLDINGADDDMLRRLFYAAGLSPPRADSMADAVLDWRDPDGAPRPFGAERTWYVNAGRMTPRNAPFASNREIALVRGFDHAPEVDRLLTVEPGRIVLSRAHVPVIGALPGVGEEALARLRELRLRDRISPFDLIGFARSLSAESRAAFLTHYAELARRTTSEPDAWILISRGQDAASAVDAIIEIRLVRVGSRAAVVRRRSWIE